jgi:hypothetical protein
MGKGVVSRLTLAGVLATSGCVGASAASPSPRTSDTKPVSWTASERARASLGVSTWWLTGEGQHSELWGLGETTDPGVAIERVHASLAIDDSERLRMDVDVPASWHLELATGDVPVVSGDMPPEVALALAQSALDAPPDPPASSVIAAASVAPRADDPDLLKTPVDCLVVPSKLPLVGTQAHRAIVGQAFDVLEQFKPCVLPDNTVPDPGNPKEKAALDACKAKVNQYCGRGSGDAVYRPILENAAAEAAQQIAAGKQGSAAGRCTYSVNSITVGGVVLKMRCSTELVECMSRAACAGKGGAFVAGGGCGGPPPSGGCM